MPVRLAAVGDDLDHDVDDADVAPRQSEVRPRRHPSTTNDERTDERTDEHHALVAAYVCAVDEREALRSERDALKAERALLARQSARLAEQLRAMESLLERDLESGLFSVRHFEQRLCYEWRRAQLRWERVAVIIVRMDLPGGSAGDAMLPVQIHRAADALRTCAGPIDVACRIDTLTFALLVPATTRSAVELCAAAIARELAAQSAAVGFALSDDVDSPTDLAVLALRDAVESRCRREATGQERGGVCPTEPPTLPCVEHDTWIDGLAPPC